MPKYIYYNPNQAFNYPVFVAYDTDLITYPNLPSINNLLELTDDQWNARMQDPAGYAVSGGVFVSYSPPPPVLSLIEQAQNALGNGIQITSSGTPSINGTYDISTASQNKIQAVSLYIMQNNIFPGNNSTYPWVDMNGKAHTFPSTSLFQHFATAIADYISVLDLIISGENISLPSQPVEVN